MADDLLAALEGRVQQAAERIRTLKEENSELKGRVEELETQLAEDATGAASAWQEEREEIRRRVEELTATLERLLD